MSFYNSAAFWCNLLCFNHGRTNTFWHSNKIMAHETQNPSTAISIETQNRSTACQLRDTKAIYCYQHFKYTKPILLLSVFVTQYFIGLTISMRHKTHRLLSAFRHNTHRLLSARRHKTHWLLSVRDTKRTSTAISTRHKTHRLLSSMRHKT